MKTCGKTLTLSGFYHPRGCMGAAQSHLDLEPPRDTWLWRVSKPRGETLPCRAEDACIVIQEPLAGLEATICVIGRRAGCSGRVHVMATRAGALYIGPVSMHGKHVGGRGDKLAG